MHRALAAMAVLTTLSAATAALAFGTVSGVKWPADAAKQDAEHERITRLALGCGPGGPCFGPKTLDTLAGRWSQGKAEFGAVGGPDRSDKFLQSPPHCDNGDALDEPGYPALNRDGLAPAKALETCREFAAARLSETVEDAGGVLDAKGAIRPGQVPTACTFVFGVPGRAKCNALEAFGVVLHTSQDFYAHSNWADRPDPARRIGADNPPGLGMSGPAPFISLRGPPTPPPAGLISGCYAFPDEMKGCAFRDGGETRLRVMHAALNKDVGTISASGIGPGRSPRGAVQDNFRRAVQAAAADSRDKWALLTERLAARYGPERGARIACALKSDDPVKSCR